MSRVTFYFIACLMVLITVACGRGTQKPPKAITKVGDQCRARGFAGACRDQNLFNNELGCLNLVCAARRRIGNEAHNTGFINDGTPCGPSKACSNGVCVQRGSDSSPTTWRLQSGFLESQTYNCIIPAAPVLASSTPRPRTVRRPYSNTRV